MADSTHTLKIKADFETGVSGSGTGTGTAVSDSSGLGVAQTGIAAASMIQMKHAVDMILPAFQAVTFRLKELNTRIQAISYMYRKTHDTISQTDGKLKHLTEKITKIEGEAVRATDAFKTAVSNFAEELKQRSQSSGNAIERERRAREENTRAIRQNSRADVAPVAKDNAVFGRDFKKMIGAFGAQQMLHQVVDIGTRSGMMTDGQRTSSTISQAAGTGLAAGLMFGPIGGLVGAGVGALTGLLKDLGDRMSEAEDELQQLNEATEQWVRRLREEKKARDEALLSIQQMARSKEIDQFVGQISDLNKKFREIESNVEDLQGAIDLLGRKLQNNEISIADYVKEHDQLAQKLQFEQQLLNKIGQKRLQQIQEEQAEQDFIDQQRESSWDYLNKIRQQDQQYKAATQVEDVSRYGTFGEILQSLDIWSKKATEEQQLRNEFYDKMTKATVAGDFENIKDLRKAYESHQSELEAVLKNRADLAGGLQDVFKELMTYKGLNVNDLGTLAGLGGFGSTSVLGDPMLDLQREQNRLLGDMLRAIREQDRQAKYL